MRYHKYKGRLNYSPDIVHIPVCIRYIIIYVSIFLYNGINDNYRMFM